MSSTAWPRIWSLRTPVVDCGCPGPLGLDRNNRRSLPNFRPNPLPQFGPLICDRVIPNRNERREALPVARLRRSVGIELVGGSRQFVLADLAQRRVVEVTDEQGPLATASSKEKTEPSGLLSLAAFITDAPIFGIINSCESQVRKSAGALLLARANRSC